MPVRDVSVPDLRRVPVSRRRTYTAMTPAFREGLGGRHDRRTRGDKTSEERWEMRREMSMEEGPGYKGG